MHRNTQKERFKEHTTNKHTSQLSIGYTCERNRGRLQKKKDNREHEIHKSVVPLVNIVALCMTEELALREVNPIAELLEKHEVHITPFWRGKNYPLVFVRSGATLVALQFEEVRDFAKGPFGLTVDETTDIAVQKQMIVYSKAKCAVRFLGLINIESGSGQGLLEATVKLVGDRGINICNVTCFSSDGASAMVGAKGGLRTRLNKYIYSKLHLEFDENAICFSVCTESVIE